MTLNYSLNGLLFSFFGLTVNKSSGLLDGLSLKEPLTVSWPDQHGIIADLSRPRFEARTITLSCDLIGSDVSDFDAKRRALEAQLQRTGTQRLMLSPIANKPLVYEVYCKAGINIDKKFRDGKMYGKFDLVLIEPQPIKWVLYNTSANVTLILTTTSPITVAWGDGNFDTLMGTAATATHTYSNGNRYYVIVAGQLEVINSVSKTNLTELWPY